MIAKTRLRIARPFVNKNLGEEVVSTNIWCFTKESKYLLFFNVIVYLRCICQTYLIIETWDSC